MAFPDIDHKSAELNAVDNKDHDFLKKSEWGATLKVGKATIVLDTSWAAGTVIELFRVPKATTILGGWLNINGDPGNSMALNIGWIESPNQAQFELRNTGNESFDQGFSQFGISDDDNYFVNSWTPTAAGSIGWGMFHDERLRDNIALSTSDTYTDAAVNAAFNGASTSITTRHAPVIFDQALKIALTTETAAPANARTVQVTLIYAE